MRTLAQMMNLQGHVAIITGGAGHLGHAIADALAELKCSLCLLDRDEAALHRVSQQLQEEWEVPVATLKIDLEVENERASVTEWVRSVFGRADILVNNAGFVGDSQLSGWVAPFLDQHMGTWRRAIEVNLTAPFHLSQVLSPLLGASHNGRIINISSIYGVVGPDLSLYEGTAMGNPAAYAASKGGLIQTTKWLSTVLAPNIRVNSICPGGIARNQNPAFVSRYEARTPLRRMGTEEDFKGAIAYLATDLSAWVTGENLMVDGGWTAW